LIAAPSAAVVTGASGFIGSTLVRTLRSTGVAVTALDLRPGQDPDVPSVAGDVSRADDVEAVMTGTPPVLFHLAARTSVLASVRDPEGCYRVNVAGMQLLLESARRHGTHQVVFTSTNAVVGDAGAIRIDETSLLRPLTPYGATKAAAEMLGHAYTAAYGVRVAAVRLTNVYGPGMATKDTFVVRLLRAAAAGRPVTVYGDGLQERDYLFVDDAVAALLLARDRGHSGPLTVGTGRSTSVLDLVDLARSVTGLPVTVEHVPAPAGEMRAVRVDISCARDIGFDPTVDLDEGLARTWDDVQRELVDGHR
jgi:UDP-glucose 4-epimerase